jgi:RND family efflux transporter MFP subunit
MTRNFQVSLLVIAAATGLRAQQPVPVDAARVAALPVERKIDLPGELLPYQRTEIHAKVAGFVQKVLVDRGSRVKAGDVLVELTAPEMDARIAEADARVLVIESEIAEAKARLAGAQSTAAKLKAASATPGVIAANELVLATQEVEAIQARVKAATASAESARAGAKALRDTQAYLKITAPFDGTITERRVHPGALAGPQTEAMFDLEQLNRLRLVVALPEREAGTIPQGKKMTFKLPAFPDMSFTGTVSRVAGSMDPKTRTMPVELDVPNPKGQLAPGMFPSVTWTVLSKGSSRLVPPTAIAVTTERTFVCRIRDGKVEWVDVVRGAVSGSLVEVRGVLDEGDVIARRGTDELRPGMLVKASVK